MKRIYLNKETRKIIEQAMPRKVRRDYKDGDMIMIRVKRMRPLKRWGDDLTLVLTKNGQILGNTAALYAWNWDANMAWIEARTAVDYYVYGDKKHEFEINIC